MEIIIDFKTPCKTAVFSILFLVLVIAGVLVFPVHAVETEDIDRIIAIVNDDIIVLSELNQRLLPYETQIKSMGYSLEKEKESLYEIRENILNQLIEEKLSDQEIARNEITLGEKEVDATIERIKKQSYLTDEDLRNALAQEGLTLEAYREQLKTELLRSKLINREIRSKIVVTPEDIQSYYDRHSEKYGSKTKYHLRHIIMKMPTFADDKREQETRDRMEGIIEKLNQGASFIELAKRYSESPLADDGGDLGEFELETLSDQIKTAVTQLKPGEYTPVLDTDQGLQIFMVQNISNGPKTPFEDVYDEIQNILYNEIGAQKYQSWIEALRKQAHIKIIR